MLKMLHPAKEAPCGENRRGLYVFGEKLLLVLVDFLEVLVGVYLQLTAGGLVTGNDAIGMQLQCGDGPCMVNAAFHAVAQSSCLVVAGDQQQHLLGIADSTNANRKGGLGDLIGVIVKETGVNDQSILGQSADACTGNQRGEGLIDLKLLSLQN